MTRRPVKKWDPASCVHTALATALLAASVLLLAYDRPWEDSALVAVLLAIGVLFIVLEAAGRGHLQLEPGDNSSDCYWLVQLPLRHAALHLPFLFLATAACAFANIYRDIEGVAVAAELPSGGRPVQTERLDELGKTPAPTPEQLDAVDYMYFSVATITTVGYGDLRPTKTSRVPWINPRAVVMLEVATGLLILICTFPLIMGRISQF